MIKNKLGREVPYKPYSGLYENRKEKNYKIINPKLDVKVFIELDELLQSLKLFDGMTLSFHHHLRNGDHVLNMIMGKIRDLGFKDISLLASGVFPVHEPLVDMLKDKTITKIYTSYMSGPVADAVSRGYCKDLCLINTHGGRPRSILEGDVEIDFAFIASPTVDLEGNVSGSQGLSACGSMGYAVVDAQMAKEVILVTDNIIDEVKNPDIEGGFASSILKVSSIGDSKGIVSGTTRVTRNPVGKKIARDTGSLIYDLGFIKDGFSFQTGAGGISLAVAEEVKKLMEKDGIKGSFASGGITSYLVNMLEEGLFEDLYDVQCFDIKAVESIEKNKNHNKMSANQYANINNKDNIASKLDVVILGCSEIDLDYNVNVTTGLDGTILGGSGGHADTAAEADFSIIVSKLVNSRISCVKDRIMTVTTPGESIDALVTDMGIAINPIHQDLIQRLKENSKLNLKTMEELLEIAENLTGRPKKRELNGPVVALSEYRDGTILDVIRRVEG